MDCAIHASMDCESHGDVPGITRVPGVPYWWFQEAAALNAGSRDPRTLHSRAGIYEVDGPEQEEPVLVIATRLVVNIAKTSTWIPLVESRRPDDDEAMTNG
jgi:hypothetical protein